MADWLFSQTAGSQKWMFDFQIVQIGRPCHSKTLGRNILIVDVADFHKFIRMEVLCLHCLGSCRWSLL